MQRNIVQYSTVHEMQDSTEPYKTEQYKTI